ncbi:MAG: hypothetical protein ABW318_14525 [Vicinamibacterales bacterium]
MATLLLLPNFVTQMPSVALRASQGALNVLILDPRGIDKDEVRSGRM